MPALLDRKGTRWALQALSPATVIVLVHRGRKSGRIYQTPLEVMAGDIARDQIVIAPLWGKDSDWHRNVLAGGLVEVRMRDRVRNVEWRELDEDERHAALEAYRRTHPIYSRIILAMVFRVNGFEGDPEQALRRELPMLALRAG
jgi:deazaflavin-dependent oxidoreductase (nitroreductase family)